MTGDEEMWLVEQSIPEVLGLIELATKGKKDDKDGTRQHDKSNGQ
jgi:hypothetical protein